MRDERATDEPQRAVAARRIPRQDAARQATAWIDARMRKLRETDSVIKSKTEPTTMAEFLEAKRKEMSGYWKERNDDIDGIIADASRMHEPVDTAAILAALRKRGQDLDTRVIFQHWLDMDPDAALSALVQNRHLHDMDYLPALLERKFGAEWVLGKTADEEMPLRLRSALVRELGLQCAHGSGLEGLLRHYNSIPDPQLKLEMIWGFAYEWPLDEPQAVVQLLAGDIPKEFRDTLLKGWPSGYDQSHWDLEWMRELCEGLGPEFTRKYSDTTDGNSDPLDFNRSYNERYEARESMTLSGAVQDVMAEGKSSEEAVVEAISIKTNQALEGAGSLIESFGEGKITRAGFLEELRSRIPGSDAYPKILEREAWRRAAWAAEPEEVAAWAEELAGQGDMDELMRQTFGSGNLYGDPRIPLRLNRYRIVTKWMGEDGSRNYILNHAAWEWTRWQRVSPANSEAWRDALPPDEPLLWAIRSEEEMNRRRKGGK